MPVAPWIDPGLVAGLSVGFDAPAAFVGEVVVEVTDRGEQGDVGGSVVGEPLLRVVDATPRRWGVAAGEGAAAVACKDGLALGVGVGLRVVRPLSRTSESPLVMWRLMPASHANRRAASPQSGSREPSSVALPAFARRVS